MAEHLEELSELVDTAGGLVVGQLTQQVDRPNPSTYLGKGKIEELDSGLPKQTLRLSSSTTS